jgi:hypothetical protein
MQGTTRDENRVSGRQRVLYRVDADRPLTGENVICLSLDMAMKLVVRAILPTQLCHAHGESVGRSAISA